MHCRFGSTRSQVRILSPRLGTQGKDNSKVPKKYPNTLVARLETFDAAYRSGNAKVSDKQFDQLENRLKEIDPQNSYFQQKMKLLGLDNYCFSEWWAKSARSENHWLTS